MEKDKFIGESFKIGEFEHFKNLKDKLSNTDENYSKYIQEKYLSSDSMMNGYEEVYKNVLDKQF